jgi:hypothetical protein
MYLLCERCEATTLEEQYASSWARGRHSRDRYGGRVLAIGQSGGVLEHDDVEDGDGRSGEGHRRPFC